MKTLIAIAFLTCANILAEDDQVIEQAILSDSVSIIVIPEKTKITKGEEIDLEVYIINSHVKNIEIPPLGLHEGYSHTDVQFKTRTFLISGNALEEKGRGISSHSTTLPDRSLGPSKSAKYKFKWLSPDEDYDLLHLKVEFFIDGHVLSGQVTLTKESQQAAPSNR